MTFYPEWWGRDRAFDESFRCDGCGAYGVALGGPMPPIGWRTLRCDGKVDRHYCPKCTEVRP